MKSIKLLKIVRGAGSAFININVYYDFHGIGEYYSGDLFHADLDMKYEKLLEALEDQ